MPNDIQLHLSAQWIEHHDQLTFDFIRINYNDLNDSTYRDFVAQIDANKVVVSYDFPNQYKSTNFSQVFFEVYSDDVMVFVESHPHLKVGCRANSMAACKNLELAGIDYIQYDPPQEQSNKRTDRRLFLETMVPRKEEYGWAIMSLNTPILVGELDTPVEFEEIFHLADIQGIYLEKFHADWLTWSKNSRSLKA
jgi:hypothetical protein